MDNLWVCKKFNFKAPQASVGLQSFEKAFVWSSFLKTTLRVKNLLKFNQIPLKLQLLGINSEHSFV